MMTRNEQRNLLEVLANLSEILPGIALAEEEPRQLFVDCLVSADTLCNSKLSVGRATYYHNVFGGMIDAVSAAGWNEMTADTERQIRQLLTDILAAAIRALQEEREVKKIFVFLPYKASMWDSLESIWKAAAEDSERTESYIVPIPYADRNPDGSPAAWHCEAEDFPSYVPIQSWTTFTLEKLKELRPDAIFIHNPYDDCNRVTSVHPQYYSRSLKECTDCLVYVPYFVSGTTVTEVLTIAPGVQNADYVIVENEHIRAQYAAYARKAGIDERKILPLGSPKIDAVLAGRREDHALPEEWERIVRGKKVVLFGTTLTPILENTEHFCEKTKEILAFFEAQPDIALWWRPHPLLRSTLKAMRESSVYEAYCQIEDEYRKTAWGIFDTSADVERAIAWADAYYGDASSVCTLFEETGKPVVLQCYDPAFPKTHTWDIDVDNNEMFFLDHFRGIFYTMDMETGKRTSAIPIPRAYWQALFEFGTFGRSGDQVVLFPHNGQHICTFDLRTRQMQEIGRVNNTYVADRTGSAFRVIPYGDCVYCFGARSNEIIRYDFQTGRMDRLTDWFLPLRAIVGEYHEHTMENNLLIACVVHENVLMIAIARTNALLEIRMDTGAWQIHRITVDVQGWQDIDFDGTHYWLVGRIYEPIVRWNRATGDVREYRAHLSLLQDVPRVMSRFFLLCIGNNVFLLPAYGDRPRAQSICIHKETGDAHFWENETGDTHYKKKLGADAYVRHVVRDDLDYILLENDTKECAYPMTHAFLQDGIRTSLLGTDRYVFNNVLSLEDIPSLLNDTEMGKKEVRRGLAGDRIYRFMRERRL